MTLEGGKEMDREKVINDLNVAKHILCNPQMLTPEMCISIGQAITSTLDLLKAQEASQWISVKDRPPESGKHVFAACEIRSLYGYKKQYVCEAFYAKEHSISAGRYPEDDDCYDYSEEDDEYYLKEGWYEVIHNWDEFGGVLIGDFVTHWMPLPEPPMEGEHGVVE